MQSVANTRSTPILFIGDIIAYIFSLILTLTIRYGTIPSRSLLANHASAFTVLIMVFLVVNFIAGLYEKQIIRARVPWVLFSVQIANFIIGIIFFYLAPVSIAPKANLFIYFIVSTVLLYIWRMIMFPVMSAGKKQSAILVGSGPETEDLRDEINENARYGIYFLESVTPEGQTANIVKKIDSAVREKKVSIIVADLHNPKVEQAMPFLYSLVFSGVQIIDASKLYEAVFDRVPLSMLGERWLVENSATSLGSRRIYDALKRVIDVVISLLGGIVSLVFYPFVCLAIKFEDEGPIFIRQKRTGKNGKPVEIIKFRSMTDNDDGAYGKNGTSQNRVTSVGKFIRKTRLDELPQFWNVLKGDLSMVGPRPELPNLVTIYEKEIPYYNARHLVKPGLFGWAQIYHQAHPHHAVATEDTRDKLSYDLYYIKNRSLGLDIKITLRTIQILMQRAGK